MICPDIDEVVLIRRNGGEVDGAVLDHIDTCDACARDRMLLEAARSLYHPVMDARPDLDELNERVLATFAERRVQRAVVRPLDMWITAALGAGTAVGTIFATGGATAPGVSHAELALLTIVGGTIAAWAHYRAGRKDAVMVLRASGS